MRPHALKGRVELDGKALTGQTVLLIAGDASALLDRAETDAQGQFQLAWPAGTPAAPAHLLVRVQGPVVALVHRTLDDSALSAQELKIQVDTTRDFCDLRGEITSSAGWPPFLTIFVDPTSVAGVPAALAKFFFRRDHQVVDSSFFEQRVEGHAWTVRVQKGNYRVGGGYLNYFRPNMIAPDSANYAVTHILADSDPRPLSGNRHSGFLLAVERDRQIILKLEVIPDEELGA